MTITVGTKDLESSAPSAGRGYIFCQVCLARTRDTPGFPAQNSPMTALFPLSHTFLQSQRSEQVPNLEFGYENMPVCDAAALPANPGVKLALTITALAEYAMSNVPVAYFEGVSLGLSQMGAMFQRYSFVYAIPSEIIDYCGG